MPLIAILLGALLVAAPVALPAGTAVAGAKAKTWSQDGSYNNRVYDDDDDDDDGYWKKRSHKERYVKREHRKAYTYKYRSPWGPFYGPPGLF